jgi:LysR family cys regulon transcriptional activator
VLARMAYDPEEDRKLGMVDASHLFESSTTRIGIRRNAWLRGFVFAFIELFVPSLTRRIVEAARRGGGTDAGL